jgi:predicted proteasome-type protease
MYQRDALALGHRLRFAEQDPYLIEVRETWNAGIQSAFDGLPRFDWESDQLPLSPPTAVSS